MKPMFPHAFDSTMIASLRSCPQKMFRTYMQHWKPKTESVHLVAGGAFAKGLEVARRAFFEGRAQTPTISYFPGEDGMEKREVTWAEHDCEIGDREGAEALGLGALIAAYGDFECPPESAKSLERTAGALEFSFASYPLGADGMTPILLPNGKRGIEFSFAEPLPINHPVTGDPILYTGRLDMIANFAGGVYIEDDKTTSSLGASWSRQWEMRSQFTGYGWALKQIGVDTAGALIRGVSILKTKYDTQQAISYRAPWELERWLEQVVRDIQRLEQMWRGDWYDYNLDNGCAEYGGCNLVQVCKSANPETWLPMYFEQRVWDPLARRQLTVREWEESWGHDGKFPGITTE
jgi:hypothetical protein